jgi:hypothetical protein
MIKYSEKNLERIFGSKGLRGLGDVLAQHYGSEDHSRSIRFWLEALEAFILDWEAKIETIEKEAQELKGTAYDDVRERGDHVAILIDNVKYEISQWRKRIDNSTKLQKYIDGGQERLVEIINELTRRGIQVENKLLSLKTDMHAYHVALKGEIKKANANERKETMKERRELINELADEHSSALKWRKIEEEHAQIENGFVYVLENSLMSGVYKIGFTARNPDVRARELSEQYKLPAPFSVCYFQKTIFPYLVEQRIFKQFESRQEGNEFIRGDYLQIIKVLQEICDEVKNNTSSLDNVLDKDTGRNETEVLKG